MMVLHCLHQTTGCLLTVRQIEVDSERGILWICKQNLADQAVYEENTVNAMLLATR